MPIPFVSPYDLRLKRGIFGTRFMNTAMRGLPNFDAIVNGSELLHLDGYGLELVIPEGVTTIAKDAIRKTGITERKRTIVFPKSIGHLTWNELRNTLHAQCVLPPGYLQKWRGDIHAPLSVGWERDVLTLATIVRILLQSNKRDASYAQELLQPDVVPDVAEMMLQIVQENPDALDRAVVFFVRNAPLIPRKISDRLVAAFPARFRARVRTDAPGRTRDAVYDPVLLDFILQQSGIDPEDAAFKTIKDTSTGKPANTYRVKCAIVPYIAEGLNIPEPFALDVDGAWVRYVHDADAAAQSLTGLETAIEAMMPPPDALVGSSELSLLVAYGRYGGENAADYLSQTWANDSEHRNVFLASLLLNDSASAFAFMIEWRRISEIPLRKYMQMRYTNPLHRMLPALFQEAADRLIASGAFRSTEYEFVVGPDMKMRWRTNHYQQWKSARAFFETCRERPKAEMKDQILSAGFYAGLYLELLREDMEQRLMIDYLYGKARPAYEIIHICTDPLLRQAVQGIVWNQDGFTFTSEKGALVRADGTPYVPTEAPVRLLHVFDVDDSVMQAWRRRFTASGTVSWKDQLNELDYTEIPVAVERYSGFELKQAYTCRKASMPVVSINQHNDCLVYTYGIDLIFVSGGANSLPSLKVQDVFINGVDRVVNRVLHQLDHWSIDFRAANDDETIVPVLERASVRQLRSALKAARTARAPAMTALLLTMIKERSKKETAASRFCVY